MTSLPLHPFVVHFPLAIAALLPFAAAGIAVAIARAWLPPRTWALVALLGAAVPLSGFAALATGEADEERAEATTSEAAIESHEHAAQRFVAVAVAAALLAALAVAAPRFGGRAVLAAQGATILAALASAALAVQTGHAGGSLVHGASSPAAMQEGHDDDD